MTFFKKYTTKYWRYYLSAIAFLTIEVLCDLAQPTIMAKIIDMGVANKNMDFVISMGGLMILVTLVGAGGAVMRNIIASRVSQKFATELRSDLFKKIQGFSFDNVDKFETASLITRLTNDVTQLQNFANGMMRIFVRAPLTCIGGIIMAVMLNPKMSMVLIITVPIVGIIIFFNARIGYPYFIKVQKMIDGINAVMREYLAGVRVVKAFNRFKYETDRFAVKNSNLKKASTTAMRIMSVFHPSTTIVMHIGIVAVLWFGGLSVHNNQMQVGQIIAFVNYMTQILMSIMMIFMVFNMFVRARASAERIEEVMVENNTMDVSPQPKELSKDDGSVEFENVSFKYTGASGEPVLKDITFSCKNGETIGIIGSTGSGKSSLVHLIPRFYDTTEGAVRVNGVDVKDVDPEELRKLIAIVPQKSTLFSGTIIENIRWGDKDATMQDIERAATISQAHDFISDFKEGYDTILGQGGVNLSGGQKQRVSIARALVKKPQILILDDSTSAVDMSTEAKMRKLIQQYANNMTFFIIAQRITSVMFSDKIIVLDNGNVDGIGTHDELMKTCKVYQDIYISQIGKEAVPNE